MHDTVICQFAKWPDLGKVKTRLARSLGEVRAQAIHIDLVYAVMKELKFHQQADFQLWLSRDDTLVDVQALENSSQELARFRHILKEENPIIMEQVDGDLGGKMQNVFERLAASYQKVIIVGSDCPSVTQSVISRAINLLDNNELVLAPAEDGGYVLIGGRAGKIKPLSSNWLSHIKWGSTTVLAETLAACDSQNLSVGLLDELWDVDDLKDYERWLASFG